MKGVSVGRVARTLEICVESLTDVKAAIAGGADRLELCSALALGGLTPSGGLVAETLALARSAGVAVHAMVRPRAGDFAYDTDEIDLAIAEARSLIAQGVDGLVFGAAREGVVDLAAARVWCEGVAALPGATPLQLVFHRAIDVVDDPVAAVDDIVALGFGHILTSGGAKIAPDGVAVIRDMVARAAGRCTIIAGSGMKPETLALVLSTTGVEAVHASASVARGALEWRILAQGFADSPGRTTHQATVRAMRSILDNQSNLGH